MTSVTGTACAEALETSQPDFQFRAELETLELRHAHAPNDFAVILEALELLLAKQRWDLMYPWAERAYRVKRDDETALYCLGFYHGASGRCDLAIPYFEQLHALYPENPVYACLHIEARISHLEFEHAKVLLIDALKDALDPARFDDEHATRSRYMERLCTLLGRIELGEGNPKGFSTQLALVKDRPTAHHVPDLPLWSGENCREKHLYLTRLGGFGDVLFYASLIPRFAETGNRISVLVQPALAELLAHSLPLCSVIPHDEDSPAECVTGDFQTTLAHLPLLVESSDSLHSLNFAPYITVPARAREAVADDVRRVRTVAGKRRLAGIAWDRAQHHASQREGHKALLKKYSSLPLSELLRLVEERDVAERFHFIALHEAGDHREWPNPMPENLSRIDLPPENFAETAAVIEACNFVISIDMSVANLAIMQDKATWVMLCHEGEWRFGHKGSSSPWLENTLCFRQAKPGDWAGVTDAVVEALLAR